MDSWYICPFSKLELDLSRILAISDCEIVWWRVLWRWLLPTGRRRRFGVYVLLLGGGGNSYWYDDEAARDAALAELSDAYAKWRFRKRRGE